MKFTLNVVAIELIDKTAYKIIAVTHLWDGKNVDILGVFSPKLP